MAITSYGVIAALGKALADTPKSNALSSLAPKFASQLPAGDTEKMDFLGMVPGLREWLGPRSAKRPLEHKYGITLKKFESTIDLPLDWINNAKNDQIQGLIAGLALRYNQWYGSRVARLINVAETELCFDGAAFFATTHSWGDSGTISNRTTFNAAVSNEPTANEAASAIVTAVSAMTAFRDDRGEPINEGMTDLIVLAPAGSVIAASAMQAIKEKNLDTGTGVRANPVMGLEQNLRFMSSARLTQNRLYLINGTAGAIPFAFLENMQDFKKSSKAADSDFEHDNDAWQFGIKAVGEAGFGRFTDALNIEFN